MDNRERQVRLWFEMWLRGEDLGIKDIFSEDAVYVESWGPKYIGIEKIKLWFDEFIKGIRLWRSGISKTPWLTERRKNLTAYP